MVILLNAHCINHFAKQKRQDSLLHRKSVNVLHVFIKIYDKKTPLTPTFFLMMQLANRLTHLSAHAAVHQVFPCWAAHWTANWCNSLRITKTKTLQWSHLGQYLYIRFIETYWQLHIWLHNQSLEIVMFKKNNKTWQKPHLYLQRL